MVSGPPRTENRVTITATRTPTRTNRVCTRCGIDVSEKNRKCRDCHFNERSENASDTAKAERRARAIARAQGWDYDQPHIDITDQARTPE